MSKKLQITIVVSVIILTIVAIAATTSWYYQKKMAASGQNVYVVDDLNKQAISGTLPSIDPKSNPLENAPDVNPVSNTNPFSNVKTNPFEQ